MASFCRDFPNVAGRKLAPSATLICLALLSLVVVRAHALPEPLDLTTTFVPALSFSETHTDKVVATVNPADHTTSYSVAATHSTSASVTANITGIALASIDGTTAFSLDFGAASIAFTLADIPTYTAGQTTAFYCWDGWGPTNKPLGTGGVKLTWTATKLTVTVTATDEASRPPPIGVEAFVGAGDTPGTFAIKDTLTADVSFGPISTSVPRTVYLTGSYKVTHVTAGPADAPLYDFDLYTVSESGAADYTRPAVALTSPKQGASVGAAVNVSGTASDTKGLSGVEWTTDLNAPWTATDQFTLTTIPSDGLWGTTAAAWTVSLSSLPFGTTSLWVHSIDDSGNTSLPLLITLVNPVPVVLTGRWDSLLVPDPTNGVRGGIHFTFAVNGSYTGDVVLEGATYAFAGSLLADQSLGLSVSRGASLPPLVLTGTIASFAPANAAAASITGSLTVSGSSVATFSAFRSPWSATNLAGTTLAGNFHVLIAAAAAPTGYSNAVVTTARAGTASAALSMADGSVVTWSGFMGAAGELPVFAPLYVTKGSLVAGSVSSPMVVDGASAAIDATTATWVRPPAFADKQFPAGFQYSGLYTSGLAYHAPSPATTRVMSLAATSPNATASWSGDGEPSAPSPSLGITVNASNTLTIPVTTDALKLSLVASSGLWTGSFKIPGTTAVSACKLIIVGTQAYGFWTAPAPTGSVLKRYGLIHIQ